MPATSQTEPESDAARKAREQAAAYKSTFAPTPMTLHYPDGTTEVIEIPPHPNLRLLDDEPLEAYEDLLFEAETTYDRHPDVILPEQRLDNGIVIPQETKRGGLKIPHQRTVVDGDGAERVERVKPAWATRVAEACLGKDKFDKLRAAKRTEWDGGTGTGGQADVWRIWNEQSLRVGERESGDPKSVRSGSGVAAVPAGNS
jgi:hypothetical protein